ncbi:type II toxin-antitoxin system death-on-curing family toxin [Novosphingobium colocasiae]|uniref:type II toxin-antitoxin system death-on-curing family toxin n=1 Tax=Novosphingobium colocasiae TaxID=1256513 RepID=UPI0035AE9938
MTDWRWVTRQVIEAVHDRQIAEHGGGAGLRDENGLESALARPINLSLYGEPDAADLAAALAFGLARNHPFVDGNKRSAWVGARLFLRLNGLVLTFDKSEATVMVQQLAAGTLEVDDVARWFRQRLS